MKYPNSVGGRNKKEKWKFSDIDVIFFFFNYEGIMVVYGVVSSVRGVTEYSEKSQLNKFSPRFVQGV